MNPASRPSFVVAFVDDEENVLTSVESVLNSEGITNVAILRDSSLVMGLLEKEDVGIVMLDLNMPVVSGMELLPRIRQEHPETSIVVITGNRDVERAIECMKAGADDYLVKPVDRARLVATVKHLVEIQELKRENMEIRNRLLASQGNRPSAFADIVGEDPMFESVVRYATAIAATSHPVLVTGETGVGKELFAKAIHAISGRTGEFVAVNVAGLDDTFFSDLLFGHRPGAYTGAVGELGGLVDRARDGTLFLDEIGDLSRQSQVKLLRTIETGEYYPLGSDLLKRGKARFVVATNRDLAEAIRAGEFRRDLYYRLSSHHVHIPPLRERIGDVPFLIQHFLTKASSELGIRPPAVPPELYPLLESYSFPGNVRELEALVFDAANACAVKGGAAKESQLPLRTFRTAIGPGKRVQDRTSIDMSFPSPLPTLKTLTTLLVTEALKRAKGNQTIAAGFLGITPQAVSKRLKSRSGTPGNDGLNRQGRLLL